jgi:hypothetical protein
LALGEKILPGDMTRHALATDFRLERLGRLAEDIGFQKPSGAH